LSKQDKPENNNHEQFTRREFIKIGGLVVSAVFLESLAACSSKIETATEIVTKTTTKTATSTVTKTVSPVSIRIGTTFSCDELISIVGSTGSFLRMTYHSFCVAPFVEYDKDGYIVPHIMTNWEIAEDNKSMVATFATDKGITWHDGKPLTIDDIIFTFDFLQNVLKSNSDLDYVEKIDDTKLKMYFKTTAFAFINNGVSSMYVYPKHVWEGQTDPKTYAGADAAIGCGPYKYVSTDMDAQTVYFEAVDNYFKGDLTVKKVSIRSFGSADALIMALKNGEIDAMNNYSSGLDASASPSITGVEGLDPGMSTNTSNYQLVFGFNKAPTDDLEFRKAASYALDYNLLATAIGGEVPGTGIIPSTNVGFDSSLPKLKQDIALAKSTLDAAGYKDVNGDGYRELPSGEPMEVVVLAQVNKTKGAIYNRIAEIVISNLNDIGVKTVRDEKGINDQSYTLQVYREGSYQLYVSFTSYVWAHYHTAFSYMVSGGNPAGGTCNLPEVLDAYEGMNAAVSTEEYKTYIKTLQQLADKYVFGLALCWDNVYFPYRTDKYKGWVNYPGNGVINNQTWYSVINK
jgi:peptide/nickel transport system substrate-binding protein